MANEATNMFQLYNANLLHPWFLINLKLKCSSFRLHQVFPTLMVQMLFFPNSTGHWSRLQKGRKISVVDYESQNYTSNLGVSLDMRVKDRQNSQTLEIQI